MLRFSAHKIEKTTGLKTILYGLKWIVTGSTYIFKTVSNGFHSYASISRSVDLPFWAIDKAKSTLKVFDSYLNSFFLLIITLVYAPLILFTIVIIHFHSFRIQLTSVMDEKQTESRKFLSKVAARGKLFRFGQIMKYHDSAYGSKMNFSDVRSFNPFLGSRDLNFGQELTEINEFCQNGRRKVDYLY